MSREGSAPSWKGPDGTRVYGICMASSTVFTVEQVTCEQLVLRKLFIC